MRRTQLILLGFLAISIINAVVAQDQMVKVDGRSIHIFTNKVADRKVGEPVLIFENGWGMDLNNWKGIATRLSDYPILLYDRGGIGNSDVSVNTPNFKNRATELQALLSTLNIQPPYILVGHSLGGVLIRAFAGYYPNSIAGLIFIDPADFTQSREQWKVPLRDIGVEEEKIDKMLNNQLYNATRDPNMPQALWDEHEMLLEMRRHDYEAIDNLPLPDVPILFFVGGKFDVPEERRAKDFDQEAFFYKRTIYWIENWNKVIRSSKAGGSLILCSNAGHFVHHDEPDIVAENIKLFMATIVYSAKSKK